MSSRRKDSDDDLQPFVPKSSRSRSSKDSSEKNKVERDSRVDQIAEQAASLRNNTTVQNAVVFNNLCNSVSDPTNVAIASGYQKPKALHYCLSFFTELAAMGPTTEEFALIAVAYQLQFVILSRVGWQTVPLISSSIATGISLETLQAAAQVKSTIQAISGNSKDRKPKATNK